MVGGSRGFQLLRRIWITFGNGKRHNKCLTWIGSIYEDDRKRQTMLDAGGPNIVLFTVKTFSLQVGIRKPLILDEFQKQKGLNTVRGSGHTNTMVRIRLPLKYALLLAD